MLVSCVTKLNMHLFISENQKKKKMQEESLCLKENGHQRMQAFILGYTRISHLTYCDLPFSFHKPPSSCLLRVLEPVVPDGKYCQMLASCSRYKLVVANAGWESSMLAGWSRD